MSNQLADKVDDLVSSIDELEDVLKPLLDTSLAKLTSELPAPLDRAKLQVWLSYVLNDLVWIYLKSRGINPSNSESGETHDVVAELDRVKGYFAKTKEAENPAKRSLAVDGKVANRFIKHALSSAISAANFEAQSVSNPTHTRFDEDGNTTTAPATATAGPSRQPEAEPTVEISSDSDVEPAAGTWKAKKRAREADLANQRVSEGQEPDSDDSLGGWEETSTNSAPLIESDKPSEPSNRTKRPRMDPFAGYDQSDSKQLERAEAPQQTASSSSAPISRPVAQIQQEAEEVALSPAASSSAPSSSGKTRRRGKKGGSRHRRSQKPSEDQ